MGVIVPHLDNRGDGWGGFEVGSAGIESLNGDTSIAELQFSVWTSAMTSEAH